MMKLKLVQAFALAVLIFPSLAVAVAPPYIVAQTDYAGQNGNTGGVTYDSPWAQTFTPTTGGILATIGAGFFTPQPGIEPYYIFQLRNTTPTGEPEATVIASLNVPTTVLTVPPASGGSYGWVDITADFSAFGIPLVAGHKYAVSIDVPGPAGTTTHNSFFWGTTATPYEGGEPFILPSGNPPYRLPSSYDFLFTVTAIPEPSVMLPACLAFGVLLWRRRAALNQPQQVGAIDGEDGGWHSQFESCSIVAIHEVQRTGIEVTTGEEAGDSRTTLPNDPGTPGRIDTFSFFSFLKIVPTEAFLWGVFAPSFVPAP